MGLPRVLLNPEAAGPALSRGTRESMCFHSSIPGYAPTPLREAPAVADALNVKRVLVKDESARLALTSFKILGASWAAYRALCSHLGLEPADVGSVPALRERLIELAAL